MTTGYLSRALAKLLGRHVAVEVLPEEFRYQPPFGAASTAIMAEANGPEDCDKNHSPNDIAECIAVHWTTLPDCSVVAHRLDPA